MGCPLSDQSLAFPLAISATRYPNTKAAAVPPAAAVRGPVKAPNSPFYATASFTPLEIRYPNPVSGVEAPAPAKSTSGS